MESVLRDVLLQALNDARHDVEQADAAMRDAQVAWDAARRLRADAEFRAQVMQDALAGADKATQE